MSIVEAPPVPAQTARTVLTAAAHRVAEARQRGQHDAVAVLHDLAANPSGLLPTGAAGGFGPQRGNVVVAARATRAFTDGDAEEAALLLSAVPTEDAVAGLLGFAALLLRQRQTVPSLHEMLSGAEVGR